MQHQYFKVDGAAIVDRDNPHQRILVYNVNIPVERAQSEETFETVRHLVNTDFPEEDRGRLVYPLYFQISAVYTLIHRQTGEERVWSGSYSPRARNLGEITAFRPYNSDTFVQYALQHCSPNRITERLDSRTSGVESAWTVGQILSVVVSIQATARTNHVVFRNHPTLLGHGGAQRQGRQAQRSVFRLDLE
jgi:hypothetical protein